MCVVSAAGDPLATRTDSVAVPAQYRGLLRSPGAWSSTLNESLKSRIETHRVRVGIIGLGYVAASAMAIIARLRVADGRERIIRA